MPAVLARPGYVYVLANPSLPGWHKVGHTHRPPHRRARELSRTALPTAFEVSFARFFWDAPAAERAVHVQLGQATALTERRLEFFQIPLEDARRTVEALRDAGAVGGRVFPGPVRPPFVNSRGVDRRFLTGCNQRGRPRYDDCHSLDNMLRSVQLSVQLQAVQL